MSAYFFVAVSRKVVCLGPFEVIVPSNRLVRLPLFWLLRRLAVVAFGLA